MAAALETADLPENIRPHLGPAGLQLLHRGDREAPRADALGVVVDHLRRHADGVFNFLPPTSEPVAVDEALQAVERLKAMKALCTWAVSERKPSSNPARDLPYLKTEGDGFHTWSDEEVLKFKERWPLGTRPHLVLTIALLTGARRSDMYAFGRPHVREAHQVSPEMQEIHPGRWLSFRQFKGRKKNPVDLVIPILPDLEEVLAASPLGEMTWITHSGGRGFKSSNALGTWFRRRANEAGLPHCSLHGLRKAGATQAANRGATAHQLMAIFGWKKISQAEVYTKKAEQQRMAAMGMGLLGTAKNTHFLHPPKKVGVSERKGQ